MLLKKIVGSLLLGCFIVLNSAFAATTHRLQISISPDKKTINVEDRILFPTELSRDGFIEFALNSQLAVDTVSAVAISKPANKSLDSAFGDNVDVQFYRARVAPGATSIRLRYHLRVEKPTSIPFVTDSKFFLLDSMVWYPALGESFSRFDLRLDVPGSWQVAGLEAFSISEVVNQRRNFVFKIKEPVAFVNLVGGEYSLFEMSQNKITIRLLTESRLAPTESQTIAEKIRRTLQEQGRFFGAYPYRKFSVLEANVGFDRTVPGIGLVSRDGELFESKVIRSAAYSWWLSAQDGVAYPIVDAIVLYLTEHHDAEQSGNGSAFRRQLMYQTDQSKTTDDDINRRAPRRDADAVKSLMILHMLRRTIGDDAFKSFVAEFRLAKQYNATDFISLLTRHYGADISNETRQWMAFDKPVSLELPLISTKRKKDGYRLKMQIDQTQLGAPYSVPVMLYMRSVTDKEPIVEMSQLNDTPHYFEFPLAGPVAYFSIDPAFDIWRNVDASEFPVVIYDMLHVENVSVSIAKRIKNEKAIRAAINRLINEETLPFSLSIRGKNETKPDTVEWMFGYDSEYVSFISPFLEANAVTIKSNEIQIDGESFSLKECSFFFVIPGNSQIGSLSAWVLSEDTKMLVTLFDRLSTFSSNSFVVLSNKTGEIVKRGVWKVFETKYSRALIPDAAPIPIPPRAPL